ncbi:hypothetical protein FACS1894201_04570 [Bacteroidia bacterium]|nr:hypothetical protein FACS1894201_04570 [Bacteroidia bacterium]
MKKFVFLTGLLLVVISSRAQVGDALIGAAPEQDKALISDEQLFRSVTKELSDDKFGGRKPLSVHEAPTLNYIANQFKQYGLQPINGNSYFQKVPMLSVATHIQGDGIPLKGAKGTLKLKNVDDIVIWTLRAEKQIKLTDVPLVFAGFGINAPDYGWNDYEGLDVKGKIVVVFVNDPGFYNDSLFRGKNMTYYGRWTYKFEEAGRQGAAGVLIIHDTELASYDWSVVQNGRNSAVLSLYSETGNKELAPIQGWISNSAAARLFLIAGTSLDNALAAAKQKGFKGFPLNLKTSIETINDVTIGESANVVGILPGTDLKDEYIIYSAHWDHLGIGIPLDGDSIYNGADDNASGVAALVLLARRFHQLPQRPRRSILFFAPTGEESGLLGSAYYAAHPLVPHSKTVINLNMDGYGDKMRTHDIILAAAGQSETDIYVQDAAAAQGRVVIPATSNTSGGYFRSDHYNFAKAGVPVVIAKGGRNYVNPKAVEEHRLLYKGKSTYHQPTDEYHDWWDVSCSLEDIYLLFGIGLRLANDGYFPKWNTGMEYKAIRENSK